LVINVSTASNALGGCLCIVGNISTFDIHHSVFSFIGTNYNGGALV
jgi:hypothetical protein